MNRRPDQKAPPLRILDLALPPGTMGAFAAAESYTLRKTAPMRHSVAGAWRLASTVRQRSGRHPRQWYGPRFRWPAPPRLAPVFMSCNTGKSPTLTIELRGLVFAR